jgi:peptide/nickel transport system substrate-binding protein
VGGGGSIVYALPALPGDLDPLTARSSEAQIVSRQVHEPLVAIVAPPYGRATRRAGLATELRASRDRTVWTVQLRSGVRFQDGTPFNAAAVLANSRRWSSLPQGRALLPGLFAVDAPRPGEVRFQLERPDPRLPLRLSDPRLGIVSPRALQPQSGSGSRFRSGAARSGTGAFQVASRRRDALELERNPSWWGGPAGLGPAIDSVSFERRAAVATRVLALRGGEAQIAGPLPAAALRMLAADPFLSSVPKLGGGLGIEASVRGLNPALRLPLMSGVWLTNLPG